MGNERIYSKCVSREEVAVNGSNEHDNQEKEESTETSGIKCVSFLWLSG